MSHATQALGRRVLSALRNENVLILSGSYTEAITVTTLAGRGVATIREVPTQGYWVYTPNGEGWATDFPELVTTIKASPRYPAPKVRTPQMVARTHGAPKHTGVSMGRFIPGIGAGVSF